MLHLLYDTEKIKGHVSYVQNCTEGICLQNIFSGLLLYLYLFKYDTVTPWKNIFYVHQNTVDIIQIVLKYRKQFFRHRPIQI